MTVLVRRARPLLGTLVDIGVSAWWSSNGGVDAQAAVEAAFTAMAQVQGRMSRFDADSDVARFNALAADAALTVDASTAEVLRAAAKLEADSGGLFNIATGLKGAWSLQGSVLRKHLPDARIDLGGIAKGYAVDRAIEALRDMGCTSAWVNAGGDLRVLGDAPVPVHLRDEVHGGARPFAEIADGALATSHYGGADSRTSSWPAVRAHVSVAAPLCLWADALTKVVALSGHANHPLLAAYDAQAWLH